MVESESDRPRPQRNYLTDATVTRSAQASGSERADNVWQASGASGQTRFEGAPVRTVRYHDSSIVLTFFSICDSRVRKAHSTPYSQARQSPSSTDIEVKR